MFNPKPKHFDQKKLTEDINKLIETHKLKGFAMLAVASGEKQMELAILGGVTSDDARVNVLVDAAVERLKSLGETMKLANEVGPKIAELLAPLLNKKK